MFIQKGLSSKGFQRTLQCFQGRDHGFPFLHTRPRGTDWFVKKRPKAIIQSDKSFSEPKYETLRDFVKPTYSKLMLFSQMNLGLRHHHTALRVAGDLTLQGRLIAQN